VSSHAAPRAGGAGLSRQPGVSLGAADHARGPARGGGGAVRRPAARLPQGGRSPLTATSRGQTLGRVQMRWSGREVPALATRNSVTQRRTWAKPPPPTEPLKSVSPVKTPSPLTTKARPSVE